MHAVVIGDSFSTTNRQRVWWQRLGGVSSERRRCHTYTWHCYAEGSTGFVQKPSGSHTFGEQIALASSDSSFQNDMVEKVVIYGGYNDYAYGKTSDETKVAIHNAYKAACSAFPYADVIMCLFNSGYAYNQEKYNSYRQWAYEIQQSVKADGTPYHNAMYWLAGYGTGCFEGDSLHPNESGEGVISAHMAALVQGYWDYPEKTLYIYGDMNDGDQNAWSAHFNDQTGLISMKLRWSCNALAAGQQKIATLSQLSGLGAFGKTATYLTAGSFWVSNGNATKVDCICYNAENQGVYLYLNGATSAMKLYATFSWHI